MFEESLCAAMSRFALFLLLLTLIRKVASDDWAPPGLLNALSESLTDARMAIHDGDLERAEISLHAIRAVISLFSPELKLHIPNLLLQVEELCAFVEKMKGSSLLSFFTQVGETIIETMKMMNRPTSYVMAFFAPVFELLTTAILLACIVYALWLAYNKLKLMSCCELSLLIVGVVVTVIIEILIAPFMALLLRSMFEHILCAVFVLSGGIRF